MYYRAHHFVFAQCCVAPFGRHRAFTFDGAVEQSAVTVLVQPHLPSGGIIRLRCAGDRFCMAPGASLVIGCATILCHARVQAKGSRNRTQPDQGSPKILQEIK